MGDNGVSEIFQEPKKGKFKTPKKAKESVLKQKSPAEFFAENKNIAGFDNNSWFFKPGKSLYTTVRELVENSLDSAESINELPSIEITVEEINKMEFNTMIGLVDRERVDEELYDDFESAKVREKRLAKEARLQEIQAKNASLGKKAKEPSTNTKGPKGRGETSFFKDNGRGMPHDDIPNMFGRVLSGTKYGLKQTRGKFGLGAKMMHDLEYETLQIHIHHLNSISMLFCPTRLRHVQNGARRAVRYAPWLLRDLLRHGAPFTVNRIVTHMVQALIWSKMSTGLPIEISSAMKGQNYTSFCRLDIDIHRNIPHIHLHEKRENKEHWHGAEIQVIIEGNWTTYRSKILHYMRQMAVITPYSDFLFKYFSHAADKNMTIKFARRTDVMPPVPLETKHHPSAVDLLLIKRLISETSKPNLLQFLQHEFVNISKSYAERLIGEMGPDFSPKMFVKSLTSQQIVRIHQLFRQAKFDDPSGDCLSPAGEYNLRLGIIKELQPDMVATHAGSPQVFEGHPFIVEAGISLGGKDVKQGVNIFRFANRIPLLFEQGADVVTRTASKRINWNSYKINQMQDKIGVFVSIVSTKIPFKGTGKEYIGDDITEISSAVKSSIQQCCNQLKSKIMKKLQARERQDRKRNLTSILQDNYCSHNLVKCRYIPDASRAVYQILEEMTRDNEPKRQRYDEKDAELLDKIESEQITEKTLRDNLTQHIEKVDYEMALEYATQSGVSEEPREDIYLNALENLPDFVDFHSPLKSSPKLTVGELIGIPVSSFSSEPFFKRARRCFQSAAASGKNAETNENREKPLQLYILLTINSFCSLFLRLTKLRLLPKPLLS
ncbi:DNA topoisomerase 6 subunit B [Dendrobium catenatum]|uniref:DNA topoisomerase 6 subunit B n=1 Tax=Dendrobium catenatum TaxID=906689 RepID=A0A2I0XAW2_9ASPA|nr:DNA topoisomerase 6 subunit B [Dendrobium catenatum]